MATGDLLRRWREAKGLTLEAAAHKVEILAIARGIDPGSKKIPRTHASLSRWETGKVDPKELGLQLIAEAYGVPRNVLEQPPPDPHAIPRRSIEVAEDQAAAVEAFIEALNRKAS